MLIRAMKLLMVGEQAEDQGHIGEDLAGQLRHRSEPK